MKVQFYVASQPGLGHYYRSLFLARELSKRGHEIGFRMTEGHPYPTPFATDIAKADWVVFDNPSNQFVGAFRYCRTTCYLGAIGDPTRDGNALYGEEERLVVIQGIPLKPVPSSWLTGFEYAILDPQLVSMRDRQREETIFYYGSIWPDMCNCLQAAKKGFPSTVFIDCWPSIDKRFRDILSGCKYAFTAFGMTALEACCLGIPQVTVVYNGVRSANYLGQYGALINLDCSDPNLGKEIVFGLQKLLGNKDYYSLMSSKAMELIDGQGVFRVADEIEKRS